jgi:hypothetical protein
VLPAGAQLSRVISPTISLVLANGRISAVPRFVGLQVVAASQCDRDPFGTKLAELERAHLDGTDDPQDHAGLPE